MEKAKRLKPILQKSLHSFCYFAQFRMTFIWCPTKKVCWKTHAAYHNELALSFAVGAMLCGVIQKLEGRWPQLSVKLLCVQTPKPPQPLQSSPSYPYWVLIKVVELRPTLLEDGWGEGRSRIIYKHLYTNCLRAVNDALNRKQDGWWILRGWVGLGSACWLHTTVDLSKVVVAHTFNR